MQLIFHPYGGREIMGILKENCSVSAMTIFKFCVGVARLMGILTPILNGCSMKYIPPTLASLFILPRPKFPRKRGNMVCICTTRDGRKLIRICNSSIS